MQKLTNNKMYCTNTDAKIHNKILVNQIQK